jgi:AcrR family transcriptional regulator
MSLAKTDGRLGRSERSRAAVAEALLALVDEGDLRPTAPRIAARAGVSLRLVFHHFKDLEAVFADAAKREIARVTPTLRPVAADGPFDRRLEAFVLERARLFERISTMWRAAEAQAPFSTEIAKSMKSVRRWARGEGERVFARELDKLKGAERAETAAALATTTSMAAWIDLRVHQELSADKARKTVVRMIGRLLRR